MLLEIYLKPLLHPDVEKMIAAVQQNPIEFEQHFAQMATPDGMWQLIIGMSAQCDRVLYESDIFREAQGFAIARNDVLRKS